MVDVVSLFRSDIFIKKSVGSHDQRQQIIQHLKTIQHTGKTMSMSNPGCNRIDNPDILTFWIENQLKELIESAVMFYQQADSFFSPTKTNLKINYWANINEPNSRNTIHTHKEDQFSAVYYLQAGDTGNLRFLNPANLLGDCNYSAPFVRDFVFKPTDGDFILWPAWVPHEVEPNLSKKERINLAFNITL